MWVPVKEASAHFGVGERAIRMACERGSKKYRFQKVKGVGGRGEVYEIWIGENDGSETKSTSTAERSGGIDQGREDASDERKNSGGCSILNDLHPRSTKSSKTSRLCGDEKAKSIDPREALKLSDAKRSDAELRCRLVMEFERRPKGMTIDGFMAELSIDYEKLKVTPSKINRWLGEYRKAKKESRNVIVALADNSGRPRGTTKLTEEMKEVTKRYLLRRDVTLTVAGIYANLKHAFGDALPSRTTVDRYIEEWKNKNRLQWEIRVNPSKAKSHMQPAHGNMSADVKYRNHRWELDGTKADVVCADGKRWLIVGAIDVFSRRPVVTLEESNTSYAVARNFRKALMKFGIPEKVVTDNGKDYRSEHFQSVCVSLGAYQHFTDIYSGEQKPFIERFFKTLSHELFQEIEGFVGHSVDQRNAIQSSMAYDERLEAIKRWRAKSKGYAQDNMYKALFKKADEYAGLPIEVPLTSNELAEWIDRWITAIYERRKHGGLGMSPLEKWQSDIVPTQTVGNVQSLDFLLGKSMIRTVEKKGIKITINGTTAIYDHDELAVMRGEKVLVIEPDDMGEIAVYTPDKEFICVAENSALRGKSRELAASVLGKYKRTVKTIVKANKEMSKLAKELDDPLMTHRIIASEKENDIPLPEMRTPKMTKEIIASNAAAEAKTKPSCEVKKVKYGSIVELFEDKIPNGGWLEHELALIEENRELYEAVEARMKKVS